MASDAEVDLVVNASRALSEVERDLDRIVRDAQANADPVNLSTVMDRAASLATVSRQVDELVRRAQAGADDIDLNAALATQTALRQVTGQLDRLVDQASRTGTADPIRVQAALNAAASLPHINRDLRSIIRRAENDADDIDIPARVDVDENSFRRLTREGDALRRVVTRAASAVGLLVGGVGALGLAAGGAAPLVAGLVTATEQLAPAAAIATQGMLAVALASNTLRLGLLGVEEAITAVFDPDADPEELAKALERLAPNARAFVLELRRMRPAFESLRLQTQNRLFDQFAGHLEGLGRRAFPVVRDAVRRTADVLNDMAIGAANAAGELAESGTLRTALEGTVRGLRNLERVPGRIVTAFGQLAAASAPAFARITQQIDRVTLAISQRLNRAFESGALERAIDDATAAFGQLFRSVSNVGSGLRNIFRAISSDGTGLFGVLESITQRFEDLTASEGFQRTLRALSETMRVLADEVGPLVRNIFEELAPVVERLAVPVQRLLRLLGDNLNRVVDELGPELVKVAGAFDRILFALEPFIDLLFDIVVAAIPGLSRGFEFVAEILTRLRPGFERITEALGPLITKLLELGTVIFDRVMPAVLEIIDPILRLNNFALGALADTIEQFVLPMLEAFVAFVQGDTTTAFLKMVELGNRVRDGISQAFQLMRNRAEAAVNALVARVQAEFNQLLGRLVIAASQKLNQVVRFFQELPGRIVSALGNIDLFSVGADIVNGMIAGVESQIGSLLGTLADLAARARNTVAGVLGIASPSKEFAKLGDFMVQGIQLGLARSGDALRRDLEGLALSLPRATVPALAAPAFTAPAPTVNVFLGNERLSGYVDTRIRVNDQQRDRRIAQGGGRR